MTMRNKIIQSLALAGYLSICGANANALEVSQSPLFLGTDVPGNLVLVPSVEWPTINSVANLRVNYTPTEEFVGYFDSNKCYEYVYTSGESGRHFRPVAPATNHECNGLWSGNFLNWAATQTIDPFRKVMTGGLRVRDTATETWLEKARHDGQGGGGIYPRRRITDDDILRGATPFFLANDMQMRIDGLGNRMRFRLNGTNVDNGTPFNPDDLPSDPDDLNDRAYDVVIRVAVCVPGLLEDNCRQYASGWKPEGLIQANFDELRYSVFGYLNDDNVRRDGAALRARQKFVGPTLPGGDANPRREWDPVTGVLFRNPDAADAAATSDAFGIDIDDSGVINYLNKFGQMTTKDHKSSDPVSELYYAAVRYMRGLDNVDAYTNGANFTQSDGFPVITNFQAEDPIEFSCQINVALGIGDIYTHRDKNLPGPTSGTDEPTKPLEVRQDDWIDVVEVTDRIGAMEGQASIDGNTGNWTGRNNSAYVAALAYWANTTDMRPSQPGKTTMSFHWVDVLEAQSLETIPYNQYILAAKYGGAEVPDDFDPMADSLEQDWWHTNGETLTPFGGRGRGISMPKPDNYFLAGNAADMVTALSQAFETILSETANVVTSVSTTSTRLDTDTLAVQARFESEFWSGELLGLEPLTNAVQWRASNGIAGPGSRDISTWDADTRSQVQFDTSLSSDIKARIAAGGNGEPVDDIINYLRGDRTNEGDGFRVRGPTVLGDIVNSRPALAGPSNEGWSRLPAPAGPAYAAYIDGTKQTRPSVVYVGANDGMLHGFDIEDGDEVMAYMPGAVLDRVGALTNINYQHQFYVDGQVTIGDAYDGGWKTVLVGGLGAGGKAIYAIDITDPDDPEVLWELSAENDPDLGYTFGEPVITRVGNEWVAVFGNGYGSQNGQAYMYVVDLFGNPVNAGGNLNNSDVQKIALGDAGQNGLSGVTVVRDPTTNTRAIRAYAGDLNGTMWRVDFSSGGTASNTFSDGLFTDPDGQAITATPVTAASPAGGIIVYFGTGRLLESVDRTDIANNAETFWAVIDRNNAINNANGFEEVSMTISGGQRVLEGEAGDDGWFVDLDVDGLTGERVLNQARVIFGQLIFTTFEPDDDACATGGQQRVYVLDAVSGTGRLDNFCENCGVIEIGVGAPIEPPVVLKPPVSPSLDPTDPGGDPPDGNDPPDLPGVDTVGAVTGWCSAFGVLTNTSGFLPLGNLCDGRQSWRQVR